MRVALPHTDARRARTGGVVAAVRRVPAQSQTRQGAHGALADQVRRFCEELERAGSYQDGQIRQAEQAVRIYFVNFLQRTDWHAQPQTTLVDADGRIDPLTALEQLRLRIRTRHYSYRTETSYADWVRRFLAYVSERQSAKRPRVNSAAVRDYLNPSRRAAARVRELLGLDMEGLSLATRAKRGLHLPVVLSVPETAALLSAMRGATWLMAALIYGGGLRVTECCQLRIKDVDFDQGLLFVRSGKGDKDRATLLADMCREQLRRQLQV